MTRIIAGRVGGRTILTPKGSATRPTTDRVREALFSRVEALLHLDGARVLDLYAGSGALGLEALSRGASYLLAVEKHRATATLVSRNARDLGLSDLLEVRSATVERVLRETPSAPFELVLVDPPYPVTEEELTAVLTLLVTGGWLGEEALLFVERSVRSPAPTWPPGLVHRGSRSYGETVIHVGEPGRDDDGRQR
ncbi:MAG: 16S rRNA (guanine(966)-N(2))-methyltransferase RsmD [Ornithinimicrobium sp.]|uniref:16S rRNA (guanine(966)-N(2))-methyltransferase RsmD n=1 Tax=Ornithinimicrobium sp. TaxID=1977084 RepID=UPI0026E08642|nr:16S rRNA (guanine(966)-N(2))-methyltransferase RsmD [Ornithinimicrobium sp.]MDO5740330.1 16S rRNA (guanine(966)-N(2))-methyltransferase RsmD [Ornithinimicrobium sp.]